MSYHELSFFIISYHQGRWDFWALGTLGPWGPLGLGDPGPLGPIGPWGPLGFGDPRALGTLGPLGTGPLGPYIIRTVPRAPERGRAVRSHILGFTHLFHGSLITFHTFSKEISVR